MAQILLNCKNSASWSVKLTPMIRGTTFTCVLHFRLISTINLVLIVEEKYYFGCKKIK